MRDAENNTLLPLPSPVADERLRASSNIPLPLSSPGPLSSFERAVASSVPVRTLWPAPAAGSTTRRDGSVCEEAYSDRYSNCSLSTSASALALETSPLEVFGREAGPPANNDGPSSLSLQSSRTESLRD